MREVCMTEVAITDSKLFDLIGWGGTVPTLSLAQVFRRVWCVVHRW
jgi:hypothetical protein